MKTKTIMGIRVIEHEGMPNDEAAIFDGKKIIWITNLQTSNQKVRI